jgi:hypothetical protein
MFQPMSKRRRRILADYPLQPLFPDRGARVATSTHDRSVGGSYTVFAAKRQRCGEVRECGRPLRTANPAQTKETPLKPRYEEKKHKRRRKTVGFPYRLWFSRRAWQRGQRSLVILIAAKDLLPRRRFFASLRMTTGPVNWALWRSSRVSPPAADRTLAPAGPDDTSAGSPWASCPSDGENAW